MVPFADIPFLKDFIPKYPLQLNKGEHILEKPKVIIIRLPTKQLQFMRKELTFKGLLQLVTSR